jgi:hypothetical protein
MEGNEHIKKISACSFELSAAYFQSASIFLSQQISQQYFQPLIFSQANRPLRTVTVTHRFSENLKRQTHAPFFFYTRGVTRLFFYVSPGGSFFRTPKDYKGISAQFLL